MSTSNLSEDAANKATDLARRVAAGERRAVAAAITELERFSPTAPPLLSALAPYLGKAMVVGFTGPPGAGKSTLLNSLIAHVRKLGKRVGVIAVDPSSPVSGGAILGDRIRMTSAQNDDGVFVRSLASGGALGGLSPAAVRVIDAFDAAGFDLILLETVGTGQTEIDVAEVSDIRVVMAAPGLGDDIQAMKAGLLEIADILVVNKADRDDAERTLQQLMGAMTLRAPGRRAVPILKTIATRDAGIPELFDEISKLGADLDETAHRDRRRRRARYLIARAAADLVAARIKSGDTAGLDRLADDVLNGRTSPIQAATELLKSE